MLRFINIALLCYDQCLERDALIDCALYREVTKKALCLKVSVLFRRRFLCRTRIFFLHRDACAAEAEEEIMKEEILKEEITKALWT